MRHAWTWMVAAALVAGCGDPNEPAAVVPAPRAVVAPGPPAAAPPVTLVACMTGMPETDMWKCDPAFGDVDGDGTLDLAAIPRLGHGPRVWLSRGRGAWRAASSGLTRQTPSCGGGVDLGDVNGDGRLDLVVADHCDGVFVYLGDGGRFWEVVTERLFPVEVVADPNERGRYVGAEDIACGDLNGDGFLDLVVGASDEGGINVFLGDGGGRRWTWSGRGLPSSGWAPRVALHDVDADGHLDIVASHCDGPRVFTNNGDATWAQASGGLPTPMMRGIYTGIDVGDVNHDGRLDIAVANWFDGPEVHLQEADGTWRKASDVFPDMLGGAIGLALGHVDADEHLDIVVSGRLAVEPGYVRGVYLLCGDGTGAFRYVAESGLPATGLGGMAGVAIADVYGDGAPVVAAGSGLKVERADGPVEPALPARLLLWRAERPGAEKAADTTR